ncbi:MAG: FtsW/RodA/SpoVE family cell cycle protein [Acidimicrobiia bacterium]
MTVVTTADVSAQSKPRRHLDWVLMVSTAALAAFGVLIVHSATAARLENAGADPYSYLKRQLVWLVLGAIAMAVTVIVDYHRFQSWAPAMYIGVVALLVLVLTPLGSEVNGAKGWFGFGAFAVQPAELLKPVMVVVLATVASNGRGPFDVKRLLRMLGLVAVPLGLLVLQPDLGSVMIFCFATFAMLVVAGAKTRHLVVIGVIGVIGVVGALQLGVVKDYQRARLTSFLDPQSNERASYNLRQSLTAIGNGGVTGRGLFEGSQTNLSYVPEQQNDFIFTAIGEQLGLIGALSVVIVYGLVVWRGVHTALLSRDFFGTLLAAGATAMIGFQAFLNMGVTVAVMPVTGVTLPLVSSGGSSILATCILVGMILNVHLRRFSRTPLSPSLSANS